MLKTAIGTKKRHHSRKKTASANPAHKNQWKTARFFWPFFQLNPAPPTGFSKHFTVHRVVSPFPSFRHEAAVGEWCFQKFPLQPCHAIICFGGVEGVRSTHPKRCFKGWFLSNLSFFFVEWCFDEERANKNWVRLQCDNVVKSEQGWPTTLLKYADWWEIMNWCTATVWLVIACC